MKSIARVLFMVLAFMPCAGHTAAPLSGTAGSNLTAYNPNGSGANNNNNWNSMMNGRSSGSTGTVATADFGNCNSVILRCASPKCGNGGCTSIDIATPIVSGCVMSNSACKQYADQGLVESIAAQLVAQSAAKTNAQMAAAQAAAAEQSAMQMEQMQMQMQAMQEQMAEQNAQQIEQLQSALAEQQRATEEALAQAAAAAESASAASGAAYGASAAAQSAVDAFASAGAASSTGSAPETVIDGLTESQRIAAAAGVSADILAREQVAGQIQEYLDSARTNLETTKARMQEAFSYAGCDFKGDNCTGPKRVSVFRQKAMEFFDPYNKALDDLYYALELAQTVGIDISDIYMMLDGSCNRWGQYLCNGGKEQGENSEGKMTTVWARYTEDNCVNGKSVRVGFSRGQNPNCVVKSVIPPEDSTACTLNKPLDDMEEVRRSWLYAENGDLDENVRVGCMSSALQNTKFFRSRSTSQAMIDIETLQRIISQDAPSYSGGNKYRSADDGAASKLKYCALTSNGYMNLENAVATKKLPSRVCVRDETLTHVFNSEGQISVSVSENLLGRSNTGATAAGYNEYACKQLKCSWNPNANDGKGACNVPTGWYLDDDGVCVLGSSAYINALRQNAGVTSGSGASGSSTSSLTCFSPAIFANGKCTCGGAEQKNLMQKCVCNGYLCSWSF